MNRFLRALALGITSTSALIASTLPAAAQPGGPCSVASDDLVSQALGAPAQAIQGISIPGLETCGVTNPGGDDISIFHITGNPDLQLDQDLPMAPATDITAQIQKTPVDGIGDSALFLRIPIDGDTLLSLRVQVGTDVYAFNTRDAPTAPPQLTALAQAVLGQH